PTSWVCWASAASAWRFSSSRYPTARKNSRAKGGFGAWIRGLLLRLRLDQRRERAVAVDEQVLGADHGVEPPLAHRRGGLLGEADDDQPDAGACQCPVHALERVEARGIDRDELVRVEGERRRAGRQLVGQRLELG